MVIFPKNRKGEINKKFFILNFIGVISIAGMFAFPGDSRIFLSVSLLINFIRPAFLNKLMLKESQSNACIIGAFMSFVFLVFVYWALSIQY